MENYSAQLPDTPDKSCALAQFWDAVSFVSVNDEFGAVDLQRYLKCSYVTVCKVIDALCALCVIDAADCIPTRYTRIAKI